MTNAPKISELSLSFPDDTIEELSEEIVSQLNQILNENYGAKLNASELITLRGALLEGAIWIGVEVGNESSTHQFEFRAPTEKDNAETSFSNLIDYIDATLKEFFEHERSMRLPLDYSKQKFEGSEIWVRQEKRNFTAERMADEWLSKK